MGMTGEDGREPSRTASGAPAGRSAPKGAIGWVGLGAIGLPMAAHAATAGWTVWAFDPSPAQQEAAGETGVGIVSTSTEAAARADGLVVCVVRTLEQVDSVLLGEGGILRRNEPPLALVMSSVGGLGLAELAERARGVGGRIVDAPILGNPAGAAAGTLTIVTSGPPDDVAAARPLLRDLARSVVELGDPVGLAQTVKMVSQLRQIAGMLATIEGVQLAVRRGAEERAVLDLLHTTEPSWATDHWAYASALWARHDRSTSLGIFAKDLAAALADAEAADVDVPITHLSHELIESRLQASDEGC